MPITNIARTVASCVVTNVFIHGTEIYCPRDSSGIYTEANLPIP